MYGRPNIYRNRAVKSYFDPTHMRGGPFDPFEILCWFLLRRRSGETDREMKFPSCQVNQKNVRQKVSDLRAIYGCLLFDLTLAAYRVNLLNLTLQIRDYFLF